MSLVKRSPPVATPPGFIQAKVGHNTCNLIQKQQIHDYQNGSVSMAMVNEVFGSLLGPNDGPHSSYDDPQYLQSINLQAAYDARVVPFFGDMVTAQVLNNRANFLSTHVCPLWETNEQNFTVHRKEFNSVPFTQISELGVPDEQTHFSYSWNDSMEKVAMNARISRDLALDENFGQEAWTDELAQFASNASLTVNINIIYSYLDNGWKNIAGNVARGEINTNPQRLLMREAEDFLIFARDSVRGLAKIRNYEDDMPEMDTVIGPGGFMQYLRDLQGEAMTIPSQRPWSNPQVQGLMLDIYDGPDSFKTMRLGNRLLSFFELHPFMVNLKTQRKFQPLTQKVTLGQFHPPNPNVTPYDAIYSNNPDQLDTYLFYQTTSIGREDRITMRQRLEGCQYWNVKDKQVAQLMHDYVRHLNVTETTENTPWPWNLRNPKRDLTSDINKDTSDYAHADMAEVHGKRSLHDMKSWRALPCGISYNPAGRDGERFFIPRKLGDFMLGQLPNEWALKAVRHLTLKTRDRTGFGDLDIVFARVDKIIEMLKSASWTDSWVAALINKNVVKMIGADGKVVPVRTSAKRLANFPGAHAVNEFLQNADGSFDLPDKDGTISDVAVPAGYANGPGIITLAREANKPNSLWGPAGEQAAYVVNFFTELHHIAVTHIGATDSTNTEFHYPWYQSETPLAVLIDAYVDPEGPTFMGVPREATRYTATSEAGPSAPANAVDSTTATTFLTDLRNGALVNQAISNRERALVSVTLGPDLNNNWIAFIYSPTDADFSKFIIDTVIEVSGYTRDTITAPRVKNATLIAKEAVNADTAEKKQALRTALDGSDRDRKALIARLDKNYPNTEGVTTGATALKEYEQRPETVNVARAQFAETTEAEAVRTRPPAWRGTYTTAPSTWLRTPLSSSEALRSYLRGKTFSYVLPADETHFFELPEDLSSAVTPKVERMDDESTTASSSTKSMMFTAMRPLKSLLNASGSRPFEQPSESYRVASDDLFAPLTVSSLLQMPQSALGARPGESSFTQKSRGRPTFDGDADASYNEAVSMRFMGPWRARRAFARNEITSAAERFFFHLLMEAPNTLDTPVRMASLGAELFGVMMVRPFIQAKTDALILTVAGPKTALYAFGHSTIQVSKEARGLFHLTCGFYHGVVRLNPDNMQLLLNALPREFIGGKTCRFMTDPSHFGLPNPDKESILAFLIPVSERATIASPMNTCNNETYQLEREGNAIYERKCSAFGGLYQYIYRTHNPATTDAAQHARTTYGMAVPAATVVHLGPTAYTNPQTMRKEDVEGVGPSGERVMNMPGAQLVWNGQSHRFGQRSQYELTTL